MPLLALNDASLAFGHVSLLDHADFQLDAGERVALIGRNGTGKSSLLAALAGLGGLDDGSVWMQPGLRLAYVPQEPPFAPEQKVFAAVVAGLGEVARQLAEYHAVSHRLAESGGAEQTADLARLETLQHELEATGAWSWESQAERVIERFGLDAEATVGTLSGGQKKRLALAQALVGNPDVLLLDEPTTYLDLAHQIDVLDLLAELNEEGRTIIMVLHDLNQAARYADTIIALRGGQIIAQGAPDKVIVPETILQVFGLEADVVRDPVTGTPLCVPIGRRGTRQRKASAALNAQLRADIPA